MTTSNEAVSLYIHFPFCVKKCAYCAFFSVPNKSDEIKNEYISACIKRIISMPKSNIKTIYFGGGTPTSLDTFGLIKLLECIFKNHNVSEDAEITLEANPGTVNDDALRVLCSAGFNRLSLGLQSANDKTLKLLGRIHTLNDFLHCYDNARKYFNNISTDIIFGLPDDDFTNTLKFLEKLHPEHFSAYSLMLEEGTPLFERRNDYAFPNEDEEEAQYFSICNELPEYNHYEISSFARSGCESKHNTVYWKRGEYIGIGAGAHSFYKNRRFFVPNDINSFITNSDKPFLEDTNFNLSKEISPEEAEEERIMLGLRLAEGVVLNENQLKKAEKFVSLGYGKIKNNVFSLNSKGFRISNYIISNILF